MAVARADAWDMLFLIQFPELNEVIICGVSYHVLFVDLIFV